MGCFRMSVGRSVSSSHSVKPNDNTTPEPNPYLFYVKKVYYFGKAAAAIVQYPHCTTFEGNKLIVFSDKRALEKAQDVGYLDPHFTKDGAIVARFRPDQWPLATSIVRLIG